LLDKNGIIKIVDFGLSNLMKDGKYLKTFCGSPNYAAPEIVGQRKYEGTAVDIWSCGVILYTMLTFTLPFDENTVKMLYKKIESMKICNLGGTFTIPSDMNYLAADLISKMLTVNPCQRIRIHEIKNHPWMRDCLPIYHRTYTLN